MPTLFKDQDGTIKEVVEARELTIEHLDSQVVEAELALQRAKDLRDQFISTRDMGNVPEQAAAAQPQEPAAPEEPASSPTPQPVSAPAEPVAAPVASEPVAPVAPTPTPVQPEIQVQ